MVFFCSFGTTNILEASLQALMEFFFSLKLELNDNKGYTLVSYGQADMIRKEELEKKKENKLITDRQTRAFI